VDVDTDFIPAAPVLEPEPEPEPLPTQLIPFDMGGWHTWNSNEITIIRSNPTNILIVNSNKTIADTAGFAREDLGNTLQGRTLILEYSNTEASRFSEYKMVKLEYSDGVVVDSDVIPIDGYIPSGDRRVEYKISDNFAGRLNFVFYQAELNNLKITAWYQ